jgi:hypothetical protein
MRYRLASSFVAISLLSFAAGACTSSSDATLTIVNQETFSITDLYIGPNDGTYPTTDNLLADGPLPPGTTITVSVACDTYDVEIIDATNTDCFVAAYDLCGTDDQWDLDDAFFNTCATSPRVEAPKSPTHATPMRLRSVSLE